MWRSVASRRSSVPAGGRSRQGAARIRDDAAVLAAPSPYAWQADVDTTVVIPALTLLYLFAVGRYGASRPRIAGYAASMALLAVAFWTPLHPLGLHHLLTAHLLQNV